MPVGRGGGVKRVGVKGLSYFFRPFTLTLLTPPPLPMGIFQSVVSLKLDFNTKKRCVCDHLNKSYWAVLLSASHAVDVIRFLLNNAGMSWLSPALTHAANKMHVFLVVVPALSIFQSDISKNFECKMQTCNCFIVCLFVKVNHLVHLIMCHCQATIYRFCSKKLEHRVHRLHH